MLVSKISYECFYVDKISIGGLKRQCPPALSAAPPFHFNGLDVDLGRKTAIQMRDFNARSKNNYLKISLLLNHFAYFEKG